MSRFSRGFKLAVDDCKNGTVIIWHKPLVLRLILEILEEHLKNRFVIVYKGEFWGGLEGEGCRTVADFFKKKGIPFKSLRNGYVAFQGGSFQEIEKQIRGAISGGRFQWIDSKFEPPYHIFKGFKTRDLEPDYGKEPTLPEELGAEISCLLSHDEVGGITVQSGSQLEPLLIEGLLVRVAAREYDRLAKRLKRTSKLRFASMGKSFLKDLRSHLSKKGITCLRPDIRLRNDDLIMTCWQGFPQEAHLYNKTFDIRYSIKKGRWSISMFKSKLFPYQDSRIFP